jgi:hypothetical protein
VAKHLVIPEGYFIDGVIDADMKDLLVPQQSVQCQLNQECRFADAGTRQDGSQLPGFKMLTRFLAKQVEWISQHKVFNKHIITPFFHKVGFSGGVPCR